MRRRMPKDQPAVEAMVAEIEKRLEAEAGENLRLYHQVQDSVEIAQYDVQRAEAGLAIASGQLQQARTDLQSFIFDMRDDGTAFNPVVVPLKACPCGKPGDHEDLCDVEPCVDCGAPLQGFISRAQGRCHPCDQIRDGLDAGREDEPEPQLTAAQEEALGVPLTGYMADARKPMDTGDVKRLCTCGKLFGHEDDHWPAPAGMGPGGESTPSGA